MQRWLIAVLLGVYFTARSLSAPAIGFPARYAPLLVQPAGGPERAEFDLRPALERARREHKRVYVYLGAIDCPFCRKYEAFLDKNADALVAQFAKDWLVVDLHSRLSLKADSVFFRVGDRALPYTEFMRSLNDERVRQLVYPSVWLLDADAKSLMQMPSGTGTFETVPEQLEILRLEQ